MKTCCRCKRSLREELFTKNAARKDGLNTSCAECHRKYTKAHYAANKQYYLDKAGRNSAEYKKKLHAIVDELKSSPCQDCGGFFPPVAMDLDHVRGKKLYNISHMISMVMPIERVLIELEKCDVRCANCHRIRTASKRQYGPADGR